MVEKYIYNFCIHIKEVVFLKRTTIKHFRKLDNAFMNIALLKAFFIKMK